MGSVITSPYFISSHLDKPKNETLLLKRIHNTKVYYSLLEVTEDKPFSINSSSELEPLFETQSQLYNIVGLCHGILCLSDYYFDTKKEYIVLWNPSFKKHLVLPESTIIQEMPCHFVLGFGVVDHDFKVVRVIYGKSRDSDYFSCPKAEVEVFSLKIERWQRLMGIDLRLQVATYYYSQLFLDGVHWLGFDPVNKDGHSSLILVFWLAQDVFDEIKLPDELTRESVVDLSLNVIGESLTVIKHDRYWNNNGSCDVWLMKKYGVESSWTRLYGILLVEGMANVVAIRKNREALMGSRRNRLVTLDLEKLDIKNLGIQGKSHSFHAKNFVKSLELLTVDRANN